KKEICTPTAYQGFAEMGPLMEHMLSALAIKIGSGLEKTARKLFENACSRTTDQRIERPRKSKTQHQRIESDEHQVEIIELSHDDEIEVVICAKNDKHKLHASKEDLKKTCEIWIRKINEFRRMANKIR
ncbi:12138_t:CDS:2, partial [Dentiscutata erythropus]